MNYEYFDDRSYEFFENLLSQMIEFKDILKITSNENYNHVYQFLEQIRTALFNKKPIYEINQMLNGFMNALGRC